MPKIYILLPVHNRKEITRGFVECLKAQTVSNYYLVLIDDGSTDGTAEMVCEYIPATTILRGTGNWWWAGSLQCGLDWLKEHGVDKNALVLFINDDVHFSPDYLERAIRVMASKMGVLMLSRYKSPSSVEIRESGVSADLRKLTFKEANSAEQINCLSTRGLFVHWGDVQAIGDFHPRLLPHYLSDYEYTIRAYRKGLKCETCADLTIEENNKTTGYHVINEIRFRDFVKKHFSKKFPGNPIYFSSFVLLTCRPVWIIVNLMKIWARVIKNLGRALIPNK
jgi:GT2 family glycosyltransferase